MRIRGRGCHIGDSSGTLSPRGRAHHRPWDRLPQPGRGTSRGVPGRCGAGLCSRAADAGRAGPGGRGAGSEREPTSGSSSGWDGSVWPPAARHVERSGVERLDIKEGRGVGQENGGRSRPGLRFFLIPGLLLRRTLESYAELAAARSLSRAFLFVLLGVGLSLLLGVVRLAFEALLWGA